MAGAAIPGGLVETGWLAGRLDDPSVRIVESTWFLPGDPRSGRAEFEAGHIAGARYWDIDEIADRGDARPHMLPPEAEFRAHMDRLGIGDDTHVVAYDRVGMMTVGRVWWTLRFFGHDRVSILDGGFAQWTREARPVEKGRGAEGGAPTPFAAKPRPELVRDLDQVAALLDRPGAQILDARSAARFDGAAPEPRPGCRSGHIPGSANLPFDALVDPGTGAMRPPDELRALFEGAGVDPARPVVATCGSGVTACLLAFGLHLLGHDRAAVYDGSWSEWGARADTPIEPAP